MPPVQERKHDTHTEASKGFKAKLGTSNIVSYEDLLIAQYIDDIKKGPDVGNKSGSSPYLGKYTSLEEGLSRHGFRPHSGKKERPASAYPETDRKARPLSGSYNTSGRKAGRASSAYADRSKGRGQSGDPYSSHARPKPKIDAKFIADPTLWDPATPREESKPLRRTRSAQYRQKSAHTRLDSAQKSYSSLIDHEVYMSRRPKKKKPLYKRQPYVIRCTAFKNGDRDICSQIAAPNIKQLLEACTTKLQLNGAARRIFLEDGSEIFETDEVPRDGEIYVSNGEAFKNPFKTIIQRHEQKEQLQWTMSGLTLPPKSSKKKSKFLLSKRFKEMVTVNTRRIMVYLNGQHTNCHEVISDLKSMDDFLAGATNKLALRSHARIVYDWSGNEVKTFDQIPVLDACLQEAGTPVLGPVWVSCGGGFSPSGACKFFEEIIAHLNKSLKEAKYNRAQLQHARDGEKDKVELVTMLSMNEEEIGKNIKVLDKDISEMNSTLEKMTDIHEGLSEEAQKEESAGYSYTLQHIKEINADDRSVGGVGLKLKLYRNGEYGKPAIVYFNIRQASRGIKNSKLVFERLLDQCASRLVGPSSQGTKFARRLFDVNGQEVTDVGNLKTDQELFLSMGESFKMPYVLCLQAQFEQVRGIDMQYPPEAPQRQTVVFHTNAAFLETAKADWEGTIGLPPDYDWVKCSAETDDLLREEITSSKELDVNGHWLVHKDPKKRDMVIYPSLVVSDRKKRGSNELWPAESQIWLLTKGGYIASRAMPFMVMAVLDTRVDCQTKGKTGVKVAGYAVGLQKKQEGNPAQQWRFTKDGAISSVSQSQLILTFLGAKYSGMDDDMIVNEVEGLPSGFTPHLAVCEKIAGKDASLQRFALKQERFDNLGQWKLNDHNVVTNPEFNKLAYSWPVNAENQWNEQFDWPMEFYFIAKAPPLHKSKKESTGHTPLRLVVMKNGESDPRHCSPVVGPDLTNMIKDLSKPQPKKSHHHGSPSQRQNASNKSSAWGVADQDDSVSDFPLHCDELTFRELEFRLFLERCTGAMNLPFAARRLFDAEGREHHTLKDLNRDDLVYATCGEAWIDPKISKAESQRRLLLTNLASDIAQIRQFCALRDTEGYVLEVEGAAVSNAKVIVNHCPEMQNKIESEVAEQQAKEKETRALIEEDLLQDNTTAHERSHQKLDDKGDKLKWPWERIANDELSDIQESPRRDSSSQRTKSGGKVARNVQKFVYDDGYICCQADQSLVLAVVSNAEGQQLEVSLAKKKPDELSQLWLIKPNGYIHSRAQRDMVLTVAMPTNHRRDEEGLTLNYVGCQVVVAKKRLSQFGSANQKWNVDQETGYIFAFHTNHLDVEIAAANKANVCTYAVIKDQLDQPGYVISLPQSNNTKHCEVVVCTSCARSMRGKYKLTKIPESHDFSCAMGTTKLKELKQIGSFFCLNGKVDLSTFEAINTLDEWETKYNKLYEEHSVRSIAREISASNTPQSVKIYAYKNGEGRSKEGQLIVGSSIIGLLDQCTYRLSMNSAARRLYTRDGTVIVDVEDLVAWAVEHYTANMQAKNRRKSSDNGGMVPESTPESEATTSTTQYHEMMVETAAEGDSYQPVNEEPIEVEFALFDVTTGCNDHVALIYNNGTEANVLYEVVIGRTSESAIIIHPSAAAAASKGDNYDDLVVNKFAAVAPSGEVSEKYWLSWSQSTIRVGRGEVLGEQEFMSAKDSERRTVNYIVVASQGADTSWNFRIPVMYRGSVPNSQGTGPTEINKLMDKVELNEDEDEDTGSKIDDLSETVAAQRRVSRPKTAVATKVETPPVDVILRYPVEVWASPGDKFIKPERVAADQKEMKHYRKLVSDITFSLQKEKHKLRQLQGRRLMGQHPGYYESTGSSVNPVVKRNHWQELTYGEAVAHDEVHQLQTQQLALQAKQRSSAIRPVANRLYTQPTMKRVLAYVNGEPISRAQYIWGDNFEQILQNATTRLNLRKAAKAIFSLGGQQLKFEDLEKDQIICVSTGGSFQRPKDIQQEVEIRANWTRARQELGPGATDITVQAHLNPDIDVDPFGPPSLVSYSDRKSSK